MPVSAHSLSPLGRSAISTVGVSRASLRPQLDPVEPTDPLKDPTSTEYRELQDLKERDREVRQHEQAHIAAGGAHVRGGASFTYETGPDGRRYAVGGEVSIDTSEVPNDPEATIRKMQVVRSAALAPAEPSAQDHAVAADASRSEARARADLRTQQSAESDHGATGGRSGDALAAYRDAARSDGERRSALMLDLTA